MKPINLLIAAGILTLPIFAQEVENQSEPKTISVSGSASGYAIPDTIIWDIEMSTASEDIMEAKDESDKQVKFLLKILKDKGISVEKVETGLIHVRGLGSGAGYSSKNKPSLSFTDITRTVTITQNGLTNFTLMLKTLAENTKAKVTYKFISSDYEKVNRETIAKAMAAAKLKAQAIASATGMVVKKTLKVYEYSPPEWGIADGRVSQDIKTNVHSPDATIINHMIFAEFEIE